VRALNPGEKAPRFSRARFAAWGLVVGAAAGGGLGLLQGVSIVVDLIHWPARTPIVLWAFLVHAGLGSLLGLLWGPVYAAGLGRLGRAPRPEDAGAALLSLLVFLPLATYVHVSLLPGTDLLAGVSLAAIAGLALGSAALFPLWRRILRVLFPGISRGSGPAVRPCMAVGGMSVLVVLGMSFLPPLLMRAPGPSDTPPLPPARGSPLLPNVLLWVMDTTRADHLSCCGYERRTTPFLETLAARGVTFEDAVSPSPWTLPGHASILTGRFPRSHGAHWQHWKLENENVSLPETLAGNGYATGAFVSNPFLSKIFNLDQGFDVYDDELDSWIRKTSLWRIASKVGLSFLFRSEYAERRAQNTAESVLRWIDGLETRPYFLLVNFNDPHAPYDPPGEFRRAFLSNPEYSGPLRNPASHDDFILADEAGLSTRDLRYITDLYDGELLYLDTVMDRLLRSLEGRETEREMLVVVTGDHGESFGEHGRMGHRGSLYNPTLRVPLLISGPGVPGNVRVDTRVQTIDIVPTVLEILGLDPPEETEGKSLARLWTGPGPIDSLTHRRCFAELHPEPDLVKRNPDLGREQAAVFDGAWKLIQIGGEVHHLYDLADDPGELVNRVSTEPHRTEELIEILSAWRKASGTVPASSATPTDLDGRTTERLRSLGYLQ